MFSSAIFNDQIDIALPEKDKIHKFIDPHYLKTMIMLISITANGVLGAKSSVLKPFSQYIIISTEYKAPDLPEIAHCIQDSHIRELKPKQMPCYKGMLWILATRPCLEKKNPIPLLDNDLFISDWPL